MTAIRKYWIALIFSGFSAFSFAQHGHEEHPQPAATQQTTTTEQAPQTGGETPHGATGDHGDSGCGHSINAPETFNAGDNAVHHISDANIIHVFGDLYFNLPVILKSEKGWSFMSSASFHPHHHSSGENTNEGYVLLHGSIMRIKGDQFATGHQKVDDYTHQEITNDKGKKITQYNVVINGQCYPLEAKTTYDGGILGGGVTSFMDFSITRNVFTMLLTVLILFFVFRRVANAATRTHGHAPKGLQNFVEPFYTFIRDEVAKPNIGPKYEKYMPYLMSAFFFILGLNLIGQIPFFPGSANVTGNISITIVLAVLTFLISMFSAKRHFWEHTLWMPGVPALLKIFILTPIEILGLFLKPFTLLLRLFANITAGHIVILSFVSLIFILGKSGESTGGSVAGIAASIPLTLFMMTLELLVALLQAFIFTMLSATYIGTAIEEPHHDHH
ncbi:MAG: F0F1 ATP synthase subunit A [Saprospiraceae bacterium]|nr:F0F1 ATP synthase subunit A [Saprospiraceae bacterium]